MEYYYMGMELRPQVVPQGDLKGDGMYCRYHSHWYDQEAQEE